LIPVGEEREAPEELPGKQQYMKDMTYPDTNQVFDSVKVRMLSRPMHSGATKKIEQIKTLVPTCQCVPVPEAAPSFE